uniref:SIAH-type domain-containing protein n=1 Tax=Aegilops tauschii subsp. strangulata TaxID=200361 RepID=A0A453R7K7_AEGTS
SSSRGLRPTTRAPLCGSEHFVCQACVSGGDGNGGTNKRCGPCGHAVSYTRSRFMDGVVDAYKVSCLYKGHGCAMDGIPYHSAADHKASCKHAPCYCFDCRFVGSPAKLVRHLASPSGAHAWPVEKIRYEVPQPFVVPASSEEDQRRLLVTEDGRVFLLAVGARRDLGGRRPVTVVCVRGNADADADAKPLYTGVLWVDGPPAPPRQPLGCSFRLKATVASCSVPKALPLRLAGAVRRALGGREPDEQPRVLIGDRGPDCLFSALKVASYLPLPYSALSSLLIIPVPLRDAAYDYIARNRYDWFGKDDECLVTKDRELLERFIDRDEMLGGGPSNSSY